METNSSSYIPNYITCKSILQTPLLYLRAAKFLVLVTITQFSIDSINLNDWIWSGKLEKGLCMNFFQRDNHMVTYSTFRSNRSIDFVFRFPPCSYSSMIPINKHFFFKEYVSTKKIPVSQYSIEIPQLWCKKLNRDDI